MKPLDPLAWTKLDAQRAFVSWFRGSTEPTIAEALAALNVAMSLDHPAEFEGEIDPDEGGGRAHLSCLDVRDGESGGVCLSLCSEDPKYERDARARWAIGIALAWAMGAPFEDRSFSYSERDMHDPAWGAFDALGALLLVPEDIVRDLSPKQACERLRNVDVGIVEEAVETRTMGMTGHEAALVALARDLAATKEAA